MIGQKDGKLLYSFNGEKVRVEAWGKNALRVRATQNKDFTAFDWALNAEDAHAGEVEIHTVTPDPEKLFGDALPYEMGTIRNGKLRCSVNGNGVLCFENDKGKTLLRESARRLCDAGAQAISIPPRSYKGSQTSLYRTEVRFCAQRTEKIFGMGQYQQHELDLKGCVLELAQRNSQVSVPFYVSSLGYGFLWNNPAVGQVVFGANRTEWTAEKAAQIDYLVIAGDTPSEILENYMTLTGLPPMMPEYGLGFWQCKLRYSTQEELLSVARKYKEIGITPDVIVCDYFHWPHEGDFKFDSRYWPDPEKMCRELRDMGIRLMVSVWPTVSNQSENYPEMLEKGYLMRAERGIPTTMNGSEAVMFFDATNDEARGFVWSKIKENYWDKGARLYWLDVAEPEYLSYDFDLYRYEMGGDLEVGNVYPKLYLKGIYDGVTASGDDKPVMLIRSAWAGSAKYGALVWSGDIESSFECMQRQVKAGLNSAMAGIPWWTTDIGGFNGGNGEYPLFRELFARWFAYACFCPVMRLHGNRQSWRNLEGMYCGSGADNEIWSFGEEVYGICRKYIALREQLRPYVRSLMETAHEKGDPVMRPMFYDFPEDAECWNIETQYMFGPDYIVSPVTEHGVNEQRVYLPEGKWQNIDTGETFDGGRWITAPAPIDVIPVLKRV